jgi:hypothetical protein
VQCLVELYIIKLHGTGVKISFRFLSEKNRERMLSVLSLCAIVDDKRSCEVSCIVSLQFTTINQPCVLHLDGWPLVTYTCCWYLAFKAEICSKSAKYWRCQDRTGTHLNALNNIRRSWTQVVFMHTLIFKFSNVKCKHCKDSRPNNNRPTQSLIFNLQCHECNFGPIVSLFNILPLAY